MWALCVRGCGFGSPGNLDYKNFIHPKLSGANLHDHYNLMRTVIKSRCMKDTLLSIKCQNVFLVSSVLNSISWGGLNYFRLLNFNIGSRVAQYNDQMVYKLSLSVLDGQLELEMNIDVFIQK